MIFSELIKNKKEIPPKRKDFLKKSIRECQQALDDAYQGMQLTCDPDLIDRYIYELNAANMRYRVLLRELREVAGSEASAPAEKIFAYSSSISSTNLEGETSLLNRSFR